MKRKIIQINEEKCTGCGLCIPNCKEGALQIIDNKARLISDLFCDGLGACIGFCPEGAISIEEREAEPYNENIVMTRIVPQGRNTIIAHLEHLKEHNEMGFYREALQYLKENNIQIELEKTEKMEKQTTPCGCPGAQTLDLREENNASNTGEAGNSPSQLRQWPVQLHLIHPGASYFKNADVLLAADCTAFAMGGFHNELLKGKSLAIACPKLDSNKEVYIEKIQSLIEDSQINTLTVAIMEVPCCGGLLQIAKAAVENSKRKVPVKLIVVSIRGDIDKEMWV